MIIDCDNLPGHWKAICTGDHKKANGKRHTLEDRKELLAMRLGVSADDIELNPSPFDPIKSSGVGDRLKDIITREVGASPCGECRDEIAKLNLMTADKVRENRSQIADNIVERAKTKAAKWWQRWGAKIAPNYAKARVLAWIEESITPSIIAPSVFPLNFITSLTVAIRVAPRKNPRLEETIASLTNAGFPKPIVFAEPGTGFDADVVWQEKLGAIGSFKAMCDRLVKMDSEWLLLCEDDVAFSDHASFYLRTLNVTDEVLSLYTAGPRQQDAKGWSNCGPSFVGSLAMMMRRSTLRKIMSTKVYKTWPKPDCVDRLIRAATRELKLDLKTHNPSLCQHTGDTPAIYENRKITDIRMAKDWTQTTTVEPPKVTIITPTGDRQGSFRLCERWMSQQDYTGEIQWIVVDDGKKPTTVTMGQRYIREAPINRHSLCRNIRAAVPHVTGECVFVIEDDDYYHPHYISTMVGRLQHADLVGEFGAKYYYLRHAMWRHNVQTENHASLCRTGMNVNVLPTLLECAEGYHPSIDLRLWEKWAGSRLSWRDEAGTQSLCVGIKGVEGRQSRGWRPSKSAAKDVGTSQLRLWVGKDAIHYIT